MPSVRQKKSSMLQRFFLLTVVLCLISAFPYNAIAVNYFDGSRAKEGFYFLTYTYACYADETTDKNGKVANKDFGLFSAQEILRLCYYTPDFVATVVVPFGYTKISSLDQDSFGLGDLSIGAGYFLPVKQVDILPMLFVKFPTGRYDKEKTANIGSNQYDIAPMIFMHKTMGSFSIDAAVKYYFRLENNDTDVAPGDELRLEGLIGYNITEKFKSGPAVNWMKSRDRKQDGSRISGSAREKLSLGADCYYRFPWLSVTLTYLYDIHTENSPKGHFVQLKTVYRF